MANIMKNPFDAKKEAMENILHASMSDRLVESAQKIYQDLPFAQENRLKFQLAKILSWTAGAVSFATACFALSYVLTSTLGTYLSWVAAGLISLVFELLKSEVWKQTVKHLLRYRKVSVVSITLLISLHIYSIGSSSFGAYLIPLTLTSTPVPPPPIDSVDYTQARQLDASIAALHAQNSQLQTVLINPDGKRSGTTAKAIATNNASIKGLQARKDEALQRIATASNERQTSIDAAQKAHNEAVTFQQQCTVIASVLMELLYIGCMWFIFYYLYRIFIDSLPIAAATVNVIPMPTALQDNNDAINVATPAATIPNTAPAERIVIQGFQPPHASVAPQPTTSVCQCCGTTFSHKHWGAKYCSDKCRNRAWKAKVKGGGI